MRALFTNFDFFIFDKIYILPQFETVDLVLITDQRNRLNLRTELDRNLHQNSLLPKLIS